MQILKNKWLLLAASLYLANWLGIPPAQAAIKAGQAAPAFTLKTTAGQAVSLTQFKGKVVLVDFWMPACPPCAIETPHLEQLYKKYYGQGLRIIGAAQADPAAAAIQAFQRQHGVTYPLVLDKGMKVAAHYGVETHPYAVLIDRHGIVRYVHVSFLQGEEKQIEAAIQAVLAGRPVAKAKE